MSGQTVLCSNSNNDFFVVYTCVNQVSSYNTYYSDNTHPLEEAHSVHLRPSESRNSFVENMTKRIRPIISSSSHLAFPSTSSNNMTSKGAVSEEFYYKSCQSAFVASSFQRYQHISAPSKTNNRNYTTLLHGIENRWALFQQLHDADSIRFSKDSSFPPLKSASTYMRQGLEILCQNQLYRNSFSVNTQRQTKDSLIHTTPEFLAPLLENAVIDYSLNHLCCEWEVKLGKNMSALEKCQLILQLELIRQEHIEGSRSFQEACECICIKEDDNSWSRNLYGIRRKKRCNPELCCMWHVLPHWLKVMVVKRWVKERKDACVRDFPVGLTDSCSPDIGPDEVINLAHHIIAKWQEGQKN